MIQLVNLVEVRSGPGPAAPSGPEGVFEIEDLVEPEVLPDDSPVAPAREEDHAVPALAPAVPVPVMVLPFPLAAAAAAAVSEPSEAVPSPAGLAPAGAVEDALPARPARSPAEGGRLVGFLPGLDGSSSARLHTPFPTTPAVPDLRNLAQPPAGGIAAPPAGDKGGAGMPVLPPAPPSGPLAEVAAQAAPTPLAAPARPQAAPDKVSVAPVSAPLAGANAQAPLGEPVTHVVQQGGPPDIPVAAFAPGLVSLAPLTATADLPEPVKGPPPLPPSPPVQMVGAVAEPDGAAIPADPAVGAAMSGAEHRPEAARTETSPGPRQTTAEMRFHERVLALGGRGTEGTDAAGAAPAVPSSPRIPMHSTDSPPDPALGGRGAAGTDAAGAAPAVPSSPGFPMLSTDSPPDPALGGRGAAGTDAAGAAPAVPSSPKNLMLSTDSPPDPARSGAIPFLSPMPAGPVDVSAAGHGKATPERALREGTGTAWAHSAADAPADAAADADVADLAQPAPTGPAWGEAIENLSDPGPQAIAQGPGPAPAQAQDPGPRPAGPLAPEALTRQVAERIVSHAGDRAEVQLSPVELGRLRFEITQRGEGVQIFILAERGETLDLLRRNGDQLLGDLRAMGFSGSELSFGAWGRQAETDKAPHAPDPDRPGEMDVIPVLPPSSRPLAGTAGRGLDLRL